MHRKIWKQFTQKHHQVGHIIKWILLTLDLLLKGLSLANQFAKTRLLSTAILKRLFTRNKFDPLLREIFLETTAVHVAEGHQKVYISPLSWGRKRVVSVSWCATFISSPKGWREIWNGPVWQSDSNISSRCSTYIYEQRQPERESGGLIFCGIGSFVPIFCQSRALLLLLWLSSQ